MANHARVERERLADLLEAVGPDAPTLCDGWRTRDLAAHLVLREARPDAAAGIVLPFLAARTARVQREFAALPYPELVRRFRSGPPRLSAFALPGADEAGNLVEYFVHAEDVRRAGEAGWEPEPLGPGLGELLWRRLRVPVRMELGRRTPVRLVLELPDGRNLVAGQKLPGSVRVLGEPGELLLFAFGRGARARVELSGPADELALLRGRVGVPD
ncbi:TIGR03085 family metal-binding protein [Kitasatospora sp. NPDC006697]|uniref:TIGR03085 family metal-binding protein n=1 Tax=Kitasatospora sp. NPDC006697 TaxID=3364020 RepID=UPI0036A338E4